ncbi:recQ-mediated genome instability protein 1 isoform X2 [Magnolia sinica]|uniref:recQ-mediated genome instability protein 1 isoform X2 n=1 Tax=Magnolia sinica TaxID=86752 RepID=UPI00265B48C6|nr:recQ-mediated genome instability protein 1 isoform X2 [Magnolia sinica]
MRRRLRLPTSSDEDEDRQTLISPNPNPNPNPNPSPNPSPLEIPDDDDFIDIPASPSPPPIPPPPAATDLSCPIDAFLRNHGLRLQRQWLDSCISVLSSSQPGFTALDAAGKAKLCFEQFLLSDMNVSGFGVLPENVHAMHGVELAGPFVLQVDEIVNIGLPLRDRYHDAPAGYKRCLKLSMTDGAQLVFGMEYRPIRDLEVLAPAGLKVCIRNVHIRRGLLMLVPEVLEVLGGLVEDLDAARQRLVQEVNKPPRGKRQRNGDAPSLATRARCAAWPSNTVNDHVPANVSRSLGTNPPQSLGQVATLATTGSNAGGRTSEGIAAPNSTRDAESNPSSLNTVSDVATLATYGSNARGRAGEGFSSSTHRPNTRVDSSFLNNVSKSATLATPSSDARGRPRRGFSAPSNVLDAEANSSFADAVVDVSTLATSCGDFGGRTREMFAAPSSMLDATGNSSFSETVSDVTTLARSGSDGGEKTSEGFGAPRSRPDGEASPSSNGVLNVATLSPTSNCAVGSPKGPDTGSRRPASEAKPSSNTKEINKVDEVGHLLILSGDKEIPFTYLACLLAKWTAKEDTSSFVHGKIKCFLTGVKGFQFRNRSTYELQVYVDDGSLISEVLIDHKVVQKGIRHSPEEVNAALSSSDKKTVTSMKETMKQYQLYLAKFEGTMLVEINGLSPLPVALEMDQGCPSSDAWLLLRRLRIFTAPESPQHNQFKPIDISP